MGRDENSGMELKKGQVMFFKFDLGIKPRKTDESGNVGCRVS